MPQSAAGLSVPAASRKGAFMTADTWASWLGGMLEALRRLREQWLLVVALLSALLWVYDTLQRHAHLPVEVEANAAAVSRLESRVATLETAGAAALDPCEGAALGVGPLPDGSWLALRLSTGGGPVEEVCAEPPPPASSP